MSFWSKLLGDTAAAPVKAIGDIIDDLHTSGEEKADASQKLLEVKARLQGLQADITKQEAGHRSVFVAGWRPSIGWVCGIGLGINFIVAPLVSPWTTLQTVDPDALLALSLSMMGVAGLRTVEKARGLSK
jgi:hypothetical protein